MKVHNDNLWNEIADQLAKNAANRKDGETAYSRIPKSEVIKVIQEKDELLWQQEWNDSTKGEITKSFFPDIGERISKRLQMGIKLSKIVTGHAHLELITTDLKSKTIRDVCVDWAHRPQITYYGNVHIY